MIWKEPINHCNDCYFCSVDVSGYNTKNKIAIIYPNLLSAMRPVGNGPDLSVPILSNFDDEILPMSSDASSDADVKHDNEFQCMETSQYQRFTQFQLNDLIRDLGLTKEKTELLGSRLKEKICWKQELLFVHIGKESVILLNFSINIMI